MVGKATETYIGTITSLNYQWPTVARRIRVKSGGSINDVLGGSGAWHLQITGLDQNWEQQIEILTLNGALESAWSTNTYLRINKVVVATCGTYNGSNDGNIIIENETENYELSSVVAGHGRSLQSVYTVPKGYSAIIPRAAFMGDHNHIVSVTGWFRQNPQTLTPPYSANYIINTIENLKGVWESKPEEYVLFLERTDFWVTAHKTDTEPGNAFVNIVYDLDLLKNPV